MTCQRCENPAFNADPSTRLCPGCAAYQERFAEALAKAPSERFGPMTEWRE